MSVKPFSTSSRVLELNMSSTGYNIIVVIIHIIIITIIILTVTQGLQMEFGFSSS